MLEIRDLATAYGKIEALKGVSLSVKAGEVTCLLGPNGAGKTTLMMTLAGILRPLRGSVRFEGEELVGKSPAEIVVRRSRWASRFRRCSVPTNFSRSVRSCSPSPRWPGSAASPSRLEATRSRSPGSTAG